MIKNKNKKREKYELLHPESVVNIVDTIQCQNSRWAFWKFERLTDSIFYAAGYIHAREHVAHVADATFARMFENRIQFKIYAIKRNDGILFSVGDSVQYRYSFRPDCSWIIESQDVITGFKEVEQGLLILTSRSPGVENHSGSGGWAMLTNDIRHA
jgi:hypothetical protein